LAIPYRSLDVSVRELITAMLLRKLTTEALHKNQPEVCLLGARGIY